MSPAPPPRRRVARHRAKDYWQVATHLMESARALVTLGDEEYGNAIGICLIHAVISAGDAVKYSQFIDEKPPKEHRSSKHRSISRASLPLL